MPRTRRSLAASVFILIVIGSAGFVHLTEQARFQAYHTVDVVQLLGSGMCYGVALMGIFLLFRKAAGVAAGPTGLQSVLHLKRWLRAIMRPGSGCGLCCVSVR